MVSKHPAAPAGSPAESRREPDRLNVVTLVDSLGLAGGGERFARLVAPRLDRNRFRSTLCVSRWSREAAANPGNRRVLEELRAAGVRFLGLERRSPVQMGAWRPLLGILRRDADVLHGHKFGSNGWATMLGRVANVLPAPSPPSGRDVRCTASSVPSPSCARSSLGCEC